MPLTGALKPPAIDIRSALPATFAAIEEIFEEFGRQYQLTGDRPARFAAELLLREALTNAVVHGSHLNPEMRVRCIVRMNARRLIIAVHDDGAGFDWRATQGSEADICSCSGRGMEIFRKYASRFRFNEKGNALTLVRNFDNGIQPDGVLPDGI